MRYDIEILGIIFILIVVALISSFSSLNPNNLDTLAVSFQNPIGHNVTEVTSVNNAISAFTKNEEGILDILNTSDPDESYSITPNLGYNGTFLNSSSVILGNNNTI
jgi:hypothetical protein